jgi:hypothetical protein
MKRILKTFLSIINYRIDLFFDGVYMFLFPGIRKFKPELEMVFTFGGVDYYTYKNLKDVPLQTLNIMALSIPAIYNTYPEVSAVRAVSNKLRRAVKNNSISISQILDCINEIDSICKWKLNTFELIKVLSYLLIPNKDLNFSPEKNIAVWSKQSGFLDFVFEAGVLFSLNTIILDRNAFSEYLLAQKKELERLGAISESAEIRELVSNIDKFIELYKNDKKD